MEVPRRPCLDVKSTRAANLAAGTILAPSAREADAQEGNEAPRPAPDVVRALKPLPKAPPPITEDERRARIKKARRIMAENGLGAIVLEPGTSMAYFVDVQWAVRGWHGDRFSVSLDSLRQWQRSPRQDA